MTLGSSRRISPGCSSRKALRRQTPVQRGKGALAAKEPSSQGGVEIDLTTYTDHASSMMSNGRLTFQSETPPPFC